MAIIDSRNSVWTSYTPTGAWTSNVGYAGKWRRVGDSMEILAQVTCSAVPASGNLTFSIPSGYTIDTAKILSTAIVQQPLGAGIIANTGVQYYDCMVSYGSTTTIQPFFVDFNATTNLITPTNPIAFNSTDVVSVFARVPIVGWS